ncbi:hypothetical protein F511_02154 [Dorcoceras hygrometricum]|uniref:CCHC-type domain-containing protein n=1 Tax=Dorcoceras hygrometricum TaxID=472368 RepID=A0A2Z7B3K7_9LAMI|nr:hypothetical protein F511_02154 [Dorcoceras hygrometricum]
MVLPGSPATYATCSGSAVDGALFSTGANVSQYFQSPQGSQQSNRQRFKPRAKQFKKKAYSSSSGSVSSGGSSSGGAFCGQCEGKHETSQCRGVRGLCHICGQPGHFSRACPLMGGQSLGQSQQGSAGGSSQRQQPFVLSQRSGFQPREPSRFGVPSRRQFPGPQ